MLILSALLMAGILTGAALVVDLGALRASRHTNQNLADLSALAASDALGEATGPNGQAACLAAQRYLRRNGGAELESLTLGCTGLPAACGPFTAPATVSTDHGPYRIRLTHPVANGTIADPRVAAANGLRRDDGQPCERLMVRVQRTNTSVLAGIVNIASFQTETTAVVRQPGPVGSQVPSLWLLDPVGCSSLRATGGATLTVGLPTRAGLIAIDSDGSACGNSGYTLDIGGSGTQVHAIPLTGDQVGRISLFAMHAGQQGCNPGNPRACNPSNVVSGQLQPEPARRAYRATRAPVDHRYNCRATYPDYSGAPLGASVSIPVAPCPSAPAPYVDQLLAQVTTITNTNNLNKNNVPAGWNYYEWCNNSNGPTNLNGNWIVDCGGGGWSPSRNITFRNGNVIIRNGLNLSGVTVSFNGANGSTLPSSCATSVTGSCFTTAGSDAAWVYVGGDVRVWSGGTLQASRTTVFQGGEGYLDVTSHGNLDWTAPSAGPFAGLALWSPTRGPANDSKNHKLTGGGSINLEGVFFTPYSLVNMSGSSYMEPIEAQFIAYRLEISGGGMLRLSPYDAHGITLRPTTALLIR